MQFTAGGVHTVVHCPDWQTLPLPQAIAQLPQLLLSFWVLTQALPHFVWLAMQSKPQALPTQMGNPLGGAGRQVFPHPPQLGSWLELTHEVPHLRSPPVQLKPHCPPEHDACPPGGAPQALPQLPQCSRSEPVATH